MLEIIAMFTGWALLRGLSLGRIRVPDAREECRVRWGLFGYGRDHIGRPFVTPDLTMWVGFLFWAVVIGGIAIYHAA